MNRALLPAALGASASLAIAAAIVGEQAEGSLLDSWLTLVLLGLGALYCGSFGSFAEFGAGLGCGVVAAASCQLVVEQRAGEDLWVVNVQGVLTAGHCGRPGKRWLYRLTPDKNNRGTGRALGSMRRNAEPGKPPRTSNGTPIATLDAALIQLRSSLAAAAVVRTGKTRFLTVRGVQQAAAGEKRSRANKGDVICQLGATSFYAKPTPRCGTLRDIDISQDFRDGFRRKHINVAALYSRGGDSGSAVYMRNGLAVGSLSGGADKRMFYTEIAPALASVGNPTLVTKGQALTAPTTTTGAATDLTSNTARLNGVINPKGTATEYFFEWGPDTTYGRSTPQSEFAADRDQHAVMASLTGLSPDTTYHARLVAVNTVGRRIGEDIAFKTSAPPPAP